MRDLALKLKLLDFLKSPFKAMLLSFLSGEKFLWKKLNSGRSPVLRQICNLRVTRAYFVSSNVVWCRKVILGGVFNRWGCSGNCF